MKAPLSKIARLVQGSIVGDSDKLISGAAPFEQAGDHEITVAGNSKYLKRIDDSTAAAILVPRDTKAGVRDLIQVDNPMVAFAKVLQYFHPPAQPRAGVHPSAEIGEKFNRHLRRPAE